MRDREMRRGEGVGQEPARATDRPGAYVRWARVAYSVFALVFVTCVGIQVFLAGMAVFVSPALWSWHTQFVHTFELTPLAMLVLAFVGRLPRRMRWVTAGVFLLLVLQYALVNVGRELAAPAVAALHTVNALWVFWVAMVLAQWGLRAWRWHADGAR